MRKIANQVRLWVLCNFRLMWLLLGGLVLGIVAFSGDGVVIGARENQTDINLEIGLWTPNTTVAQTFIASQDQLCRIDFYVDSYHPWNASYLECRLFELATDANPNDLTYAFMQTLRQEVRYKRLSGWLISPHMFNSVTFSPIAQSKNKRYLFLIQASGLKRGGLAVLLGSPVDRYLYFGNLFVNGQKERGDLAFRVGYAVPRTAILHRLFKRLALEKPFVFATPAAYYVLSASYLLLLLVLFTRIFAYFPGRNNEPSGSKVAAQTSSAPSSFLQRWGEYATFFGCYLLLLSAYGRMAVPKWFGWLPWTARTQPQKRIAILVIQLQKIGDLVCTTPVFRALRKQYPHAYLAALVSPLTAGILKNNPHIDEVILYDSAVLKGILGQVRFSRALLKRRFDWSFNFSPNVRNITATCLARIPNRISLRTPYGSSLTRLFYWAHTGIKDYNSKTSAMKAYLETLEFIGISDYTMQKEVYLDPADAEGVSEFLRQHDIQAADQLLVLHPFAGVAMKAWGAAKFIALAETLVERYQVKILLIGASADFEEAKDMQRQARCQLINACGAFTLAQLPALLARCMALISVDTGPLYIANALGVPVVNIAGPCDLHTQSPDGKFVIVQKWLDCVPCSAIMNGPRTCRRGDRKCLELITVDDVLNAFKTLMITD